MPINTRQIWHRQEGETRIAFNAFKKFLEQGPTRTVIATYKQYSGKSEAGTPGGYFSKWSKDYEWFHRAEAHDMWMDGTDDAEYERASRVQQQLLAKRRVKANNMAWEIAQEIFAKARLMLKMPITEKRIEKDGHTTIIMPVRFKFGDVAALVKVADTLCRLSTDMSTENVAVNINDELRRISDDTGIPLKVFRAEYKELTGRTPDGESAHLN